MTLNTFSASPDLPQTTDAVTTEVPLADLVQRYLHAKELAKAAAEACEALRRDIITHVGEGNELPAGGCIVSVKAKTRATVDWRAVCVLAQIPDALVTANTKNTTYHEVRVVPIAVVP